MSMSFAGVPLTVYTEEVMELLRNWHPVEHFQQASVWGYLGNDIDHLPLPQPPLEPEFEVGKVIWPTGMCRCGTFTALVTADLLVRIQTALGSSAGPAALVLSDDDTGDERTFPMYFESATPIFDMPALATGEQQAYLLRLVDSRWHLRTKTGTISSTPSSWTDLFSTLESALGITLTPDSIDADYGAPTDRWVFYKKPLSVILDATANAVGHRIVANLDGTFRTVTYGTAVSESDTQYAVLSKSYGGFYDANDLIRSAPESVDVYFENDGVATPYTVNVSLSSLALPDYGDATGVSGSVRSQVGELIYDGTNVTECADFADQSAADYYYWRLSDLDVTFPSIAEWTPTGLEDRIEWKYFEGFVATRVVRPPLQTLPFGGVRGLDVVPVGEAKILVRILSESSAVGEYNRSYTVRKVTSTSGNVADVDPIEDFTNVVELSDRKLKLSGGATPQEEIYEMRTSSEGLRYVVGFDLGCHLAYDDDRKIEVTVDTLAGSGLIEEEAEEGCNTLGIDVGCALAIGEDNKLNVDVAALAGTGLTVSSGDCPTLQVDLSLSAGCGIDIVDEQINLDLSEVVGPGLSWDGVECTLLSAIGCGLEFDGDGAIAVDAEVLAGNNAVSGLVSDVDGEGCETLAVDTEVTVTETETLVNNVTLTMVAGKIRLTQTKTTYTNEFNAAGIIIDRVAGSPTDSYTEIDACLVDDCCNATELTVTSVSGDPNPAGTGDGVTWTPTVTGGVAPYTYLWSFTAGYTLEGESTLTDEIPTVSWATIGSKTGTVIVTDACGNTATNNSSVSVEDSGGCCDEALEGHPNFNLNIPDGPSADNYSLSWGAGAGPGGLDSWNNTIGAFTVHVYCDGETWKITHIGGPSSALSASCEPLNLVFPPLFGSSGNVVVTLE